VPELALTVTSRARILAAAEQIVCSEGAEQFTASGVASAAGVSRTTFYATFIDRQDCLLAVFDEIADGLREAMHAAYAGESSWLDGVRASLRALLAGLDSRPNVTRFMILGGLCADSPLVIRRRRVLAELACALETDCPDRASLAAVPFGSEAVVNGAASIIHSRLREEPTPALLDLSGPLMAMLVLPFVGEGVARGELARPKGPGRPRDQCLLASVPIDAPGASDEANGQPERRRPGMSHPAAR
jgi:AcrR family transcriptional regulator